MRPRGSPKLVSRCAPRGGVRRPAEPPRPRRGRFRPTRRRTAHVGESAGAARGSRQSVLARHLETDGAQRPQRLRQVRAARSANRVPVHFSLLSDANGIIIHNRTYRKVNGKLTKVTSERIVTVRAIGGGKTRHWSPIPAAATGTAGTFPAPRRAGRRLRRPPVPLPAQAGTAILTK